MGDLHSSKLSHLCLHLSKGIIMHKIVFVIIFVYFSIAVFDFVMRVSDPTPFRFYDDITIVFATILFGIFILIIMIVRRQLREARAVFIIVALFGAWSALALNFAIHAYLSLYVVVFEEELSRKITKDSSIAFARPKPRQVFENMYGQTGMYIVADPMGVLETSIDDESKLKYIHGSLYENDGETCRVNSMKLKGIFYLAEVTCHR